MRNPFRRSDKVPEVMKEDAVADLAQFLMKYGFRPEESFKISRGFWDKNVKRLRQVYT